tara:strand:- start:1496 stop:1915 length:420 start_codon:yes stop_codon:yes gene_type:complete
MATTQVNNWADLLLAQLTANAKAYRLKAVNDNIARVSSQAGAAEYRFTGKKAKIEADHASVTWTFTKEDAATGDDVVIKAVAPVDRGGHTKVWGIIEGTAGANEGYVRKSTSDPYVDANSLGDTYRAAFFDKVNQFGWG